MLHADVEDIGGVASDAAKEARQRREADKGQERRIRGGEVLFKGLVNAKAGGAVGRLTKD